MDYQARQEDAGEAVVGVVPVDVVVVVVVVVIVVIFVVVITVAVVSNVFTTHRSLPVCRNLTLAGYVKPGFLRHNMVS